MKVLVIGGTGFIGSRLVPALARAGDAVVCLSLAAPARPFPGADYRIGDRDAAATIAGLAAEGFDAIVDLVAYHPAQAEALAAGLSGRATRIVFLSTAAAYERLDGAFAGEGDAVLWTHAGVGYGPHKAACERVLQRARARHDLDFTIVRPAALIGPDDPVSRENHILRRLLDRRPLVLPGDPAGLPLMLYTDDLVAALAAAVSAHGASGKAYHLATPGTPTLQGHVNAIAAAAGIDSAAIIPIGVDEAIRRGFRIAAFPYPWCGAARLDTAAAEADLGFVPHSYEAAIAETVGALMAGDARGKPSWPGRASTQSRLCGAHEWLHAALERSVQRTGDAPSYGPERILAAVTGAPREAGRWLFAASEDLAKRNGGAYAAKPLIAAPRTLLERLGRPILGLTGMAPDPALSHPDALAAVFEPVGEGAGPEAFWLYAQSGPRFDQDYADVGDVRHVPVFGFASLPEGATCPCIVDLSAKADRDALDAWAEGLRDGMADPPWDHLSQLFLNDALGLAQATGGWSLVFDLARRLRASDEPAPRRLRLGPFAQDGLALFAGDARWYCADLRSGRLLLLPAAAAAILDARPGGEAVDRLLQRLRDLLHSGIAADSVPA
jgi:nucleoside-diphosphate-sugar epimerase